LITLDGETLSLNTGLRYFVMNKPQGYICANRDSLNPLVFDLLTGITKKQKLHTVGRLDIDTSGLLFITDDGQWSHQLTSPRRKIAKTYRAWLAEDLRSDAEELFKQGIELEDDPTPTLPAELERINDQEVLLTIYEGRYHQVKRMFAALGNAVVKLHRERIGGLTLQQLNVNEGEFRELSDEELEQLLQSI
ncbi:MAG TPA: 16S rRNA pseudouridine(516) synthase, partial [Pseudomonadales bacterium]|nr:16S rRNA pseudouridine(516) synthase [Pseudomonadales bacterium]